MKCFQRRNSFVALMSRYTALNMKFRIQLSIFFSWHRYEVVTSPRMHKLVVFGSFKIRLYDFDFITLMSYSFHSRSNLCPRVVSKPKRPDSCRTSIDKQMELHIFALPAIGITNACYTYRIMQRLVRVRVRFA